MTELLLVVVVAGKQCEQIASIRCQVPRRPGAQVPATEFIFQCREYQPPLLFVVLRLPALSSPARTAPASSGDITMGVCYVWRSSVCFTQCHFLIDMELVQKAPKQKKSEVYFRSDLCLSPVLFHTVTKDYVKPLIVCR